jgi:hypothetical protein
MMPEGWTRAHPLTVEHVLANGLEATCACGWRGPTRRGRSKRRETVRDYDRHLVAIVRADRQASGEAV